MAYKAEIQPVQGPSSRKGTGRRAFLRPGLASIDHQGVVETAVHDMFTVFITAAGSDRSVGIEEGDSSCLLMKMADEAPSSGNHPPALLLKSRPSIPLLPVVNISNNQRPPILTELPLKSTISRRAPPSRGLPDPSQMSQGSLDSSISRQPQTAQMRKGELGEGTCITMRGLHNRAEAAGVSSSKATAGSSSKEAVGSSFQALMTLTDVLATTCGSKASNNPLYDDDECGSFKNNSVNISASHGPPRETILEKFSTSDGECSSINSLDDAEDRRVEIFAGASGLMQDPAAVNCGAAVSVGGGGVFQTQTPRDVIIDLPASTSAKPNMLSP